jgi:hypothetical protein
VTVIAQAGPRLHSAILYVVSDLAHCLDELFAITVLIVLGLLFFLRETLLVGDWWP